MIFQISVFQFCLQSLMILLLTTFISICIISSNKTFLSQTPAWLTSPYFIADNQAVISSFTGSGTTPSYQFTYAQSFSSIPNVAYGIKNYRGADKLLQQYFQIIQIDRDQTQFTVQVEIFGVTNLYLLNVAFIAMDTNFPHHLNTFDNVPINYTSGDIKNISTASATLQSFTEVINYQNQATGNTYTVFSTPYTDFKIVLYITKLWIASGNSPLSLDVTYSILNATSYSLTATLGYQASVTNLHFSMIIFNSKDIQSSNAYFVVNDVWFISSGSVGGFTPIPIEFKANFIMALTQFTTTTGQCGFEYQWQFTNSGGVDGVQILSSVPISTSTAICGFNTLISNIFYIMTWQCNSPYSYFNLTSRVCQTLCGAYYFQNSTDFTCQPCNNSVCYSCSLNNTQICLECDTAKNFILTNQTCICNNSGQYVSASNLCLPCSSYQTQCLTCTYSGNSTTAYSAISFQCLSCNTSNGYFLTPSDTCALCSVANCQTCLSYSFCSVCNPASGTSVTSTGQCSNCPITGCQTCINLTACSVCSAGYSLLNNLCYYCYQSCTCGGYTLPKYPNGDCSAICGDGIIIFPYEECDDANKIDGDGCSSTCAVQKYSYCSNKPSQCYLNQQISLNLLKVDVSTVQCNTLVLMFQIFPNVPLLNKNLNWQNFITSSNSSLSYIGQSAKYDPKGFISLTFKYSETIQNQNITFSANTNILKASSSYFNQINPTSASFQIIPTNNIPAALCGNDVCLGRERIRSYTYALEAISYLGLLLSLFSFKIVGLQLFGVLQLSYFILSDYDYVNQILAGALSRKQVNGLNIGNDESSFGTLSARVVSNGFKSEVFLANFNIMLLLMIIIVVAGLLAYMITYIINKETVQKEQDERLNNSDRQSQQTESKSMYIHRLSKYVLKQVLVTFVLFNMFNLSFSAGIQIKYLDNVDSFSIICLLISLSLVAAVGVGQLKTDKTQYGQYFDKFKERKEQSHYILVSIIYRLVLGLLLALLNEWIFSGLIFIAVSASFLTYIFYFDPFIDPIQNIRTKFIHSAHVIIIFVNLYYRLEASSNPVESSTLLAPAYIQIVVVAICVFGSTLLLSYEVYIKIKTFINQKLQQNKAKNEVPKVSNNIVEDITIQDINNPQE